jgi:capsular exopolysaccharide synthesis family protein
MIPDPFLDDFQAGNEKNLRDYFHILLDRKWLIVTITIITFALFTLYTFSKTPLYRATTQVLIEKNLTGAELQGSRMYMMWDPAFMGTQFELIRSYNVARRVVTQLQHDSTFKNTFFPEQISSEPVAVDNTEKKDSSPDADSITRIIQGGIRITPVKDTRIVGISYIHQEPEIAQMVANAVVQAYIDETLDIKSSLTKYSLQWMTSKAEEERRKLEKSEQKLQQFMRKNDIVTVENKLAILPEKLSEFSSQLSLALAKEKESEAVYNQIQAAGKDVAALETIPLFAESVVLQNLRERIYTSQQNIKELSKKYGYKHPVIIQAKAERDLLLKERDAEIRRIESSTKNGYELAKTRVKNLSTLIDQTKAELLDMNERFVKYTIMAREKEMNQAIYDALATSIKKENLTEQSQDLKIWVTQKASLPAAPFAPNRNKAMMQGMLLGLFGGAMLALFLEYLDNTVKDPKKAEERLQLTVLGTVTDMDARDGSIETYILDNPLSPVAESYRLIRSGLLFSFPDHPPRTLLITSMLQQEGKTTTTDNLAHILAQNDKTILIIDCDMRRPRQHSVFGINNTYGLSNYLSGNIDENRQLIQKTEDGSISMIPAGPVPPNPAELLSSHKMNRILEKFQQQFDFVLLDSPPVLQVTDSLMLGQLVEGTILVVRAGKTTYEMVESGVKKLKDSHIHILGLVLNRVRESQSGNGYYGYNSYYSGEHYTSRDER